MNNQSIEFQNIKEDSSSSGIVRKSFRIPIEDKENVWVLINKKRYSVRDISTCGVGILLENNSRFIIEQALLNCEFSIFNVSIKKLNGKIVHLSFDKGGNLQCGIQWIDMEKKIADQISEIVFKMKEQLLKNGNISVE